jgi:hypothetical protein
LKGFEVVALYSLASYNSQGFCSNRLPALCAVSTFGGRRHLCPLDMCAQCKCKCRRPAQGRPLLGPGARPVLSCVIAVLPSFISSGASASLGEMILTLASDTAIGCHWDGSLETSKGRAGPASPTRIGFRGLSVEGHQLFLISKL